MFWTNNKASMFELSNAGNSGSLFYYTQDRKYMLKNIVRRDFKQFRL